MSKISCNVIQDIMPLYVDEIVSEDTKKLVEEHLKECEDCRKEMEKMRAKIILPNKKKINQAEKELFQKLKCRLNNRRIAAAILGAILVCALLAGVYTILVLPKEPIPFDPQKMEVEIVGDDAYLSYLEEVTSENEMERTRRLFCEFFPFFVQFFQFGIVCIFFQCKFLTFDRIGIDFFLRHQLVDFHISFFQNSNSVFRLFQFIFSFSFFCLQFLLFLPA